MKLKQVNEPVEEEAGIDTVPVEDEYELREETREPVAAEDCFDEDGQELDQQAKRIRNKQSHAERKRARRQRRKERRRQAA